MENKEQIKIKFSTFITIVLILIIIVIGICFYISKKNKEENLKSRNEATYENTQMSEETQTKEKVYSIKEKDFYLFDDAYDRGDGNRGMKLLEYDNSNSNYVEIYYILYDYTTEPGYYYTLEITDELDNNILISGNKEEKITGGIVSTVKIKKISLKSKINFSVSEKSETTNSITNNSKIQVDLENDLEEISKIDQILNVKKGILGDVIFEYINSENVYFGKTSHSYSQTLVGENCSLPIKIQYGNYLETEEHIDFWCDKNVNNLTLDEAFKSLGLITQTFGQYGLSDVYGMDITTQQGEVIDTVVIDFDEMMKLCNGSSIEKYGKQYNKDDFNEFSTMTMIKDKDVEIGKGIKAIKYYLAENDEFEFYMFIYKDNIYDIRNPVNNSRIYDEIQHFLDSLELN